MQDEMTVSIGADTRAFDDALTRLSSLAEAFGAKMASSFAGAARSGKALDDVLRQVGLQMAGLALKQGLAPLEALTGSLLPGLIGGLARAIPFEKGGVPGRITPFADGGVVGQPTYFPMSGGLGLMGEAGAEAILPLARTADGRLGVAANDQGGGRPISIVFNVTTPDVAGFRKSEAQITGMLARAAARGTRTL